MVALLVVFPPAGVVLTWFTRWSTRAKVIASVVSLLWLVLILVSDPKEPKPVGDAKPAVSQSASPSSASPLPSSTGVPDYTGRTLRVAQSAARADGYIPVSHDASDGDAGQWDDDNWRVCFQALTGSKSLDFGVVRTEQPCPKKDGDPIPWAKMPNVVGMNFKEASAEADALNVREVTAEGAYTDMTPPTSPDAWQVCFQDPEAGESVEYPKNATVTLKVVKPGTACPSSEFTELHPDPVVTDDGGSDSGGGSVDLPSAHPGAFCSPQGARGVSSTGKVLRCASASDGRNRWQS
ncbi:MULTISPECIES: PASTA domain-containing protein [unclassified Streptomyces]|uniref:PASTA domain-containing protein n=1 Tax=unclassified Streptomyces TaxID=2593676 RepID=UPI0036E390F8